MNDAQDEIARLREEVAELRKALGERQQLSAPNLPSLRDNYEFVVDCARFAENLMPEAAVRKKYHFSEEAWERLGQDDALVEAIELEKTRRIRSGAAKRELAQKHVVAAPGILNTIMCNERENARHRIDSAKALDALADPGAQAAVEEDRVHIVIDLGADMRLEFNKAVKPTPAADTVIDSAPQEMLPIIAANKRTTDGGNGNPL
jgi:hypothetical protein